MALITHVAEVVEERSSEPQSTATLSNVTRLEGPSIAVVAEPPWPSVPRGAAIEWEKFDKYPHYLAAQIVAGLLESEGVPTIVESFAPFPGVLSSVLWVPRHLLHRVRWILSWPAPTEAELLFLATGEFPSEERKS